jgi:hypothetical protein
MSDKWDNVFNNTALNYNYPLIYYNNNNNIIIITDMLIELW